MSLLVKKKLSQKGIADNFPQGLLFAEAHRAAVGRPGFSSTMGSLIPTVNESSDCVSTRIGHEFPPPFKRGKFQLLRWTFSNSESELQLSCDLDTIHGMSNRCEATSRTQRNATNTTPNLKVRKPFH